MLSHDGTKVVFQSNRTGNWEIFTMNADGSQLKQVTNNAVEDLTPCWSPDGKKIVFASGMDNTSDIFIMNADGSARKKLTDSDGDDSHPHFSADGKKIIFNSACTSPDLSIDWLKQWHEIFIMDSNGKEQKQITRLKTVCTFPNISPDGKKVVFRRVVEAPGSNWDLSVSTRNSEIFLMDIDRNTFTNISNNTAFDGWPCWSPDGKKIVYASNRNGLANVGQLFLFNIESNATTPVSNGPLSHVQPSFSSDGKRLVAYEVVETAAYEFGGIVMIDLR